MGDLAASCQVRGHGGPQRPACRDDREPWKEFPADLVIGAQGTLVKCGLAQLTRGVSVTGIFHKNRSPMYGAKEGQDIIQIFNNLAIAVKIKYRRLNQVRRKFAID